MDWQIAQQNGYNRKSFFGDDLHPKTNEYDKEWAERVKKQCEGSAISLKCGRYMYTPGPSFETPAEIRFCRACGADAIGMSTVPEVLMAQRLGLHIMGISLISNMAAGILSQPLSQEEVFETAKKQEKTFEVLMNKILKVA